MTQGALKALPLKIPTLAKTKASNQDMLLHITACRPYCVHVENMSSFCRFGCTRTVTVFNSFGDLKPEGMIDSRLLASLPSYAYTMSTLPPSTFDLIHTFVVACTPNQKPVRLRDFTWHPYPAHTPIFFILLLIGGGMGGANKMATVRLLSQAASCPSLVYKFQMFPSWDVFPLFRLRFQW